MLVRLCAAVLSVLCVTAANVVAQAPAPLDVVDGVVFAPLAGRPMTGGFATLVNKTNDLVRIVGARSPAARVVELHEMAQSEGRMQMRKLDALDIAPQATRQLRPGGDHLMFIGVTGPMTPGETVEVVLVLQDGREVTARLTVRTREGLR